MAHQIGLLTEELYRILPQLTQTSSGSHPKLSTPLTLPAPPPCPSWHEAHVLDPEPYVGNLGRCKAFLLQGSLVYAQCPHTYASEEAKVACIMGLLRGDALA